MFHTMLFLVEMNLILESNLSIYVGWQCHIHHMTRFWDKAFQGSRVSLTPVPGRSE